MLRTALLAAGLLAFVSTAAVASGATHQGSGGTLVIAAISTPDGIDADYYFSQQAQTMKRAVYSRLIRLPQRATASGVITPDYKKVQATKLQGDLAQSWSLSRGGRTLTVRLRQGVMSHAGNEITAADVQYSWDRSWALNAVGAFYSKTVLGITKPSWRVVDKYRWQITTPQVSAILVLLLANVDLQILDSTEVKTHATSADPWAAKWLAHNDAGSGPYKVTEFAPGTRVVLTGFDEYFRGAPPFDTIIYRAVPDQSQRRTLVQSGAVDIAENISHRDLLSLRSVSTVRVWATPANRLIRLIFNTTKPPFNNPAFRKAILYATPREAIARTTFSGFGTPLKGPIPQGEPYAATDLWPYNTDLTTARRLLTDGGIKPGTAFTINYNATVPYFRDMAVILQSSFKRIGLSVSIKGIPAAVFFTNANAGKYDAAIHENSWNTPDPGYALTVEYPCKGTFNVAKYCNRQVDALLRAGFATISPPKRNKIYRNAQRLIVVRDAVEDWIVNPGWQLVTKRNIAGVAWDPSGVAELAQLRRTG